MTNQDSAPIVRSLSGDWPALGMLVIAGLGPVLVFVGTVFLVPPVDSKTLLILAGCTLFSSLLAVVAVVWIAYRMKDAAERAVEQVNLPALREARDKMAALVSSVDGIVWEADIETFQFTFVSERAVALLGYAVDDWKRPNFWADHIHPEDREKAVGFCVLETHLGRNHRFEYRMIAADGRAIWMHDVVSVVRKDGSPHYLRGIMVDVTELKEADFARQASERRLQAIFDAVPDCIKITDEQGGVLEMNTAGLAMLEAESIAQVRELGFAHFLRPENRAALQALHRHTVAGGPGGSLQFGIIGLKGTERWLESILLPMAKSGPTKGSVLSVTSDITERRRIEIERVRMQHRLQSAVVASRLIWWEWSLATGELHIHACGAPCILGYSAEQLAGVGKEGWIAKTHPEDRDRVTRSLDDVLTGRVQSDWVCEHRLQTMNGGWLWVRNIGRVAERSSDGSPLLVMGTTQDVDEHQRNVESIRRERERLQLTLRASRMGIWHFSLRSGQSEWDARMYEIYDLPAGSPPPTREGFETWVHVDDLPLFRGIFTDMKKGQFHFDSEFRILHRNGDVRHIRFLGSVQADYKGHPEWVTAVNEDITDRVAAETNRRQLVHQLAESQKMETLGTLAGGIAHDFNNILTGIIGYIELTKKIIPPVHLAQEHLKNALKGSRRASDLVKRLMLFSRRSPATQRRPVLITEIAKEAIQLTTAGVPANITINLESTGQIPLVNIDPTQIEQVLMNLIINGAHAIGGRAGQITLSVKFTPEAGLKGVERLEAGYVCVTVSDTGCGMDAETQARIFDPFFTTRNPGEGTGLGLSIVHGIVYDHGGHIVLESEPGKGSRFELYLPALPFVPEAEIVMPVVQAARPPENEEKAGKGERILVVDDEECVRQLVRHIGDDAGFTMEIFADWREAERLFAEASASFSLALLDLSMPERTGWEIIASLRNIRRDLPVILMSGDHARHPTPSPEPEGVFYLEKPFAAEELVSAIRTQLGKPRAGV